MTDTNSLVGMQHGGVAASKHDAAQIKTPDRVPSMPAPPIVEFELLSPHEQHQVWRLSQAICAAWGIPSPGEPFPAHFHPDPNTSNWGVELLSAILRLAKMTGGSHPQAKDMKDEAVALVCRSIGDANKDCSIIEGDYVIRRDDIEYAIKQMHFRVNTYRPDYRNGSSRPAYRVGRYRPAQRGDSYRPAYHGDSYRPAYRGDSYRPDYRGDSYRPDYRGGHGRHGRQGLHGRRDRLEEGEILED